MRLASLSTCLLLPLLLLAGRDQAPPTQRVKIRLVDAQSGAQLPGLIRITGPDGQAVPLPSLLSRGVGLLQQQPRIGTWSVLPGTRAVSLRASKPNSPDSRSTSARTRHRPSP